MKEKLRSLVNAREEREIGLDGRICVGTSKESLFYRETESDKKSSYLF